MTHHPIQEPQHPRPRSIRVGELRLHVDDFGGDGPAIVFAHPTGFLGAIWRPLIARLRASGCDARIYTFDTRGHGLSSKPDKGYEWPAMAADFESVAEELGLSDALGVGHSMGGAILVLAAAAAPALFRRLLLFDPITFDPDHETFLAPADNPMAKRTRTRRLVWASREALYENFATREPYKPWTEEALRNYIEHGTFDRPDGEIEILCPGRIEAQVYQSAAQAGTIPALRTLAERRLPIHFVRGEGSHTFSQSRADHARTAAGGRLSVVAGSGHFIPMEKPDEVAAMIFEEWRTR